jgi:subtilisin family serine protease
MAKKTAKKRQTKRQVRGGNKTMQPLADRNGQPVHTVIYVHGIGNKPLQSVLKCQWDRALFGIEMGDRSRLAYWVDRECYPEPTAGTCGSGDLIDPDVEVTARSIGAQSAVDALTDEIETEIEHLAQSPDQARLLRALARKLERQPSRGKAAKSVGAKLVPLPPFMRRWITKKLTKAFLRDVNDFFFDAAKRAQMEKSLTDRLTGPGPYVIVAHSQGTMVAYEVLRKLKANDIQVPLFVTIGSPLGLAEVQDVFKTWTGKKNLATPACVERWVNVADRLDPVAFDSNLRDDFTPKNFIVNHNGFGVNPDAPRHPHSGTGYLSTQAVRNAVRDVVGPTFGTPLAGFVIARDLADDLEDQPLEQRHRVLIELVSSESREIDKTRAQVLQTLQALTQGETANIEMLRHFVAAELTRSEIELVRAQHQGLSINRVWCDSVKSALLDQSIDTVQARTANIGYRALGQKIEWAVLDTGINVKHPHFKTHDNVKATWDCTKPGAPKEGAGDGHGHGSHVAGIIAGELELPNTNDEITRLSGMAPQCGLHIYKVLDDDGSGQDSWIIKALDHIAETNEQAGKLVIHGINLSLGGPFDPSVYGVGHSPLCGELRRLWRQGVLVVIAAGNEGYQILASADGEVEANMDLTIADPANLEEAIAVGSIHKRNPHTYGVSYFSSRGPTADGRMKPDLVAPGEKILSASHRASRKKSPQVPDLYVAMSGTSTAAPHVSGLLAAYLSVRPEFIGHPERVKTTLLENCTDLARDPYIQGRGMPNLVKMLANT